MCLVVKIDKLNPTAHLRTAEIPIKCYKIVRKTKGKYMTPFQDAKIRWTTMKGITSLRASGLKIETASTMLYSFDPDLYVYEGVIHSMAHPDEALDFIRYIRDEEEKLEVHPDAEYEIWRCVIPKGTKYMEGEDLNHYHCFGSRRIKFVEKFTETDREEKKL